MNAHPVPAKPIWHSKTFWFNVTVIVLSVALLLANHFGLTEAQTILNMLFSLLGADPHTFAPEVELGIYALINVFLRMVTKHSVKV